MNIFALRFSILNQAHRRTSGSWSLQELREAGGTSSRSSATQCIQTPKWLHTRTFASTRGFQRILLNEEMRTTLRSIRISSGQDPSQAVGRFIHAV